MGHLQLSHLQLSLQLCLCLPSMEGHLSSTRAQPLLLIASELNTIVLWGNLLREKATHPLEAKFVFSASHREPISCVPPKIASDSVGISEGVASCQNNLGRENKLQGK